MSPQGTLVATTLAGSPCGCVYTGPAPRAVRSTATTTPRPSFQAWRARISAGEDGGFSRGRTSSLTPSSARVTIPAVKFQRRVFTLGDPVLTVKGIVRNSTAPAPSGAGAWPKGSG